MAPKTEVIEQLTARVRELEEENARLKAECDDIKQVQFPRKLEAVAAGWKKQLAASQLHAEQLRVAIDRVRSGAAALGLDRIFDIATEALALHRDTSALNAYIAENVS